MLGLINREFSEHHFAISRRSLLRSGMATLTSDWGRAKSRLVSSKRLAHGTVPTIFNQLIVRRSPSQREKRSNERRKRNANEDSKGVLHAQIIRVSTEVALNDHGHVLYKNKVHREEAFKGKDYELEIAVSSRFICPSIS